VTVFSSMESHKRCKVSKNLFFSLPEKLRAKIYSYDPTYHEEFQKVLKSIPVYRPCMYTNSNNHCFGHIEVIIHVMNQNNITMMVSSPLAICKRHMHRTCNMVVGAMSFFLSTRVLHFHRRRAFERTLRQNIKRMVCPTVLKRPKLTLMFTVCNHFCGFQEIRMLFHKDFHPVLYNSHELVFNGDTIFDDFRVQRVNDNVTRIIDYSLRFS